MSRRRDELADGETASVVSETSAPSGATATAGSAAAAMSASTEVAAKAGVDTGVRAAGNAENAATACEAVGTFCATATAPETSGLSARLTTNLAVFRAKSFGSVNMQALIRSDFLVVKGAAEHDIDEAFFTRTTNRP
jgi:hypothetical protein